MWGQFQEKKVHPEGVSDGERRRNGQDRICLHVSSEKMVTRPMLRVWVSKYSQKVTLQIEGKSY